MRNVDRPNKPSSLKRLGREWKSSLLKKKAECDRNGKKIPESYFTKYSAHPDIRQALESMYTIDPKYGPLCCYCESPIEGKGELEHIKPKSKFIDKAYDWNNWHLVCRECNGKAGKGENYNTSHEILDPWLDRPISDYLHLGHDPISRSFGLVSEDARGDTTIDLPKLDRDILTNARQQVREHAFLLIEILKNPSSRDREIAMAKEELRALRAGKSGFVSVVEYIIGITSTESLL